MGRDWWKIDERSTAFVGSQCMQYYRSTVHEPEGGMGSCTRHSLSVSADSAESPSPSQMQRCKVIPPTGQNRNHILHFHIEDARPHSAAPDSKRHYDAPQAVRHSARFRRSYLVLAAERDMSRLYFQYPTSK
jgi:hypothetical protein